MAGSATEYRSIKNFGSYFALTLFSVADAAIWGLGGFAADISRWVGGDNAQDNIQADSPTQISLVTISVLLFFCVEAAFYGILHDRGWIQDAPEDAGRPASDCQDRHVRRVLPHSAGIVKAMGSTLAVSTLIAGAAATIGSAGYIATACLVYLACFPMALTFRVAESSVASMRGNENAPIDAYMSFILNRLPFQKMDPYFISLFTGWPTAYVYFKGTNFVLDHLAMPNQLKWLVGFCAIVMAGRTTRSFHGMLEMLQKRYAHAGYTVAHRWQCLVCLSRSVASFEAWPYQYYWFDFTTRLLTALTVGIGSALGLSQLLAPYLEENVDAQILWPIYGALGLGVTAIIYALMSYSAEDKSTTTSKDAFTVGSGLPAPVDHGEAKGVELV